VAQLAGVGVNVDESDVVRELQGFWERAAAADMSDVAEELKVAIDDVFQAQGAVAGRAAWPPRKNNVDPGRALLIKSGVMANIQTSYGRDYAQAASPAPYAVFHVSKAPRTIIPLRDFLAIDEDATLERIGEMILQDVER